jgi:hypothetical protein
MNRSNRNKTKRRGGAATVFPAKYFDATAYTPDASRGVDLLGASGMTIRPKIGGRRKTRKVRKSKKTKGGFVPTVMESFVAAASKYIVPIALFSGYKLMTRKGKKGSKRSSRR